MGSAFPRKDRSITAGDPTVAVLLTWVCPGAGHLYLGRPLFALVAFALIQGVYFLGLSLSDWMGFEFLQKEMRGPFAPALSPEAANLGAIVTQMKLHGFGFDFPRPWPQWIHLGVTLTALSGVMNVCLMVQAHLDARRKSVVARELPGLRSSPALDCFLAWLVPGLGHLHQGRKLRAGIVFATLVGLLVLGTLLAEGSNLSRERHYYYWGGQFMAGLPAIALELAHGHAPLTRHLPYAEAGLVIASIAGMLNILSLLDVYGFGEARYLGKQETAPAAPEPGELEAAT